MLDIPTIKNPLERECIEYSTNHIPLFVNLSGKTIEELEYYRRNWKELVMVQPPYRNADNNTRYNDWSILSKSKGIDTRFEASSLIPENSTLRGKALLHLLESRYIPETEMVLVLLGNGYNSISKEVIKLSKEYYFPITVLRTVKAYKKYIDKRFKKVKHLEESF